MGRNINFVIVFAILVASCAVIEKGDAATYIVGDSVGWTIPTGGASFYTNWASPHDFRIGDILVFNFTTGAHDVAKVTKAAYDGCSSNSPISLITLGPANVTLDSIGEAYYICTFGQHCSIGQKLAITVAAASTPMPSPAPAPKITPPAAPAPTPIISPPGAPAPTPTPTGGMSPSPSPVGGKSPSLSPNPTPSPGSTPPPAPGGSPNPLSPPPGSPPAGEVSPPPPPPPNSAATTAIATSFVIFASIAVGLTI